MDKYQEEAMNDIYPLLKKHGFHDFMEGMSAAMNAKIKEETDDIFKDFWTTRKIVIDFLKEGSKNFSEVLGK